MSRQVYYLLMIDASIKLANQHSTSPKATLR